MANSTSTSNYKFNHSMYVAARITILFNGLKLTLCVGSE